MKKLFIMSDIHGFYDEMMKVLNDRGFDINNNDHIFVSCGDLLDRGSQANKCLKFVNDLPEDRKILITGNHELLMDNILYRKRHFDTWDYSNGTVETIEQITGISQVYDGIHSGWNLQQAMIDDMRHNKSWEKYYKSTHMCIEIGNSIFVHGWIPGEPIVLTSYPPRNSLTYNSNWRDTTFHEWENATWLNGMSAWNDGVKEEGKTIFCGHWHTSWGHSILHKVGLEWNEDDNFFEREDATAHFEPFEDDGIVALDSCTAYSGFCNCYTIEVTEEEWENRKEYC